MPTRSFTTQCSNNLVVQSGGDGGDPEEDRRHFFSADPGVRNLTFSSAFS